MEVFPILFFRSYTIGDIRLGLYSDYFTAISSDRDNIIFFLIIGNQNQNKKQKYKKNKVQSAKKIIVTPL